MKQHFMVPPTEDSVATFGVGSMIGGVYRLEEKIGQGSFGMIFKCVHGESSEVLAVKLEKRSSRHSSMLVREIKVMMEMKNEIGFAKMQSYGKDEDFNYVVMSYLGRNMDSLLKKSGNIFTMRTVINVADQMLTRLESLHAKNLIHRDIKPENYVIGYGANFTIVHLIDFGLAKYFKDSEGNHIPFIEKKGMIGTARYASVNAHLGHEQSRRDDLEALGYVFIYFARGKLPWQNINAENKDEKYEKIKQMKMQLTIDQICEGLPLEFVQYFNIVKALGFEETPNYTLLKKVFHRIDTATTTTTNTTSKDPGSNTVYPLDWESLPDYRQRKKYQTTAPGFASSNALKPSQQVPSPHQHQQAASNQPTIQGSKKPVNEDEKRQQQQQVQNKQQQQSNNSKHKVEEHKNTIHAPSEDKSKATSPIQHQQQQPQKQQQQPQKQQQQPEDQKKHHPLQQSAKLIQSSSSISNPKQHAPTSFSSQQKIPEPISKSLPHGVGGTAKKVVHSTKNTEQQLFNALLPVATVTQQLISLPEERTHHEKTSITHNGSECGGGINGGNNNEGAHNPTVLRQLSHTAKMVDEAMMSNNNIISQYLIVPAGNEKATVLTHSVASGGSGGGMSRINNYLWSESEDVTSEEGIKLTEHISKSSSSNTPYGMLRDIRKQLGTSAVASKQEEIDDESEDVNVEEDEDYFKAQQQLLSLRKEEVVAVEAAAAGAAAQHLHSHKNGHAQHKLHAISKEDPHRNIHVLNVKKAFSIEYR